jgi:hypothetical protein
MLVGISVLLIRSFLLAKLFLLRPYMTVYLFYFNHSRDIAPCTSGSLPALISFHCHVTNERVS